MAWQLIDPHVYADHLRRLDPATSGSTAPEAATALWYQDDSPIRPGELAVQLDASGTLLWFQLAHTVWPHGGERIAEWRRGAGLRVGTIHDDAGGHYRNMSPLIHYAAQLDPVVVADLVDYFLSHADVLDATLRESVAEALWQSTQDGGA